MSDPVREALAELVALKDLKDSITEPGDVVPAIHYQKLLDYNRRKPAAWAAARAALAQPAEPVAPPSDCGLTECQGKPMCARCRHQARGVAQPAEPVASDTDSWEANAQYLLDRCSYTVWQRPGAGPADLKASLVVTFQGMQMRLDGHPMYAAPPAPQPAEPVALIGALARLWPLLDKATKDYVFTAERAGEVAADMNMLRAAVERAARTGGNG